MSDLKETFSQIYDQWIEKIFRFVFLKVNSEEVAQDLTSETFTRCWECFKNGDKIDNPSAFLYQIARNLVVDFYRQEVERAVDNLLSVLEPVMVIFLGGIVAGLMGAILLPLYQMTGT